MFFTNLSIGKLMVLHLHNQKEGELLEQLYTMTQNHVRAPLPDKKTITLKSENEWMITLKT